MSPEQLTSILLRTAGLVIIVFTLPIFTHLLTFASFDNQFEEEQIEKQTASSIDDSLEGRDIQFTDNQDTSYDAFYAITTNSSIVWQTILTIAGGLILFFFHRPIRTLILKGLSPE